MAQKPKQKKQLCGYDTVYVHTDIKKIEVDNEGNEVDNLYEYHEVQYEKDEYIQMMAEKNKELENELTDMQLAIVEMYEGGIQDMAKIYYSLIEKGLKTIDDVPEKLRKEVQALLDTKEQEVMQKWKNYLIL